MIDEEENQRSEVATPKEAFDRLLSSVSIMGANEVVHLKGFASRINWSNHSDNDVLDRLSKFKVIVWDGDNYDSTSFTRMLPLIKNHEGSQALLFVAFKLQSAIDEGWPNYNIIAGFPDDFKFEIIPINDRTVTLDYHELGIKAVEATGATQIIALGGGGVVKKEYDDGPSTVEWTLVPYTRPTADGSGVERPSLMEYVEKGKPRITVVDLIS